MLIRTFCIALGLVLFSTVDCRSANPRFWWLFPEFDNEAPSKPTRQTDDSFSIAAVDDAIADDQDTDGQLYDDWDSAAKALETALDLKSKGVDDSWNEGDEVIDQNGEFATQSKQSVNKDVKRTSSDTSAEETDDWDPDALLSSTGEQETDKSQEISAKNQTVPATPNLVDRIMNKQPDNSKVGQVIQSLENSEWVEDDSEVDTKEYSSRQIFQNEDVTNQVEHTENNEETVAFDLNLLADDQENDAEGFSDSDSEATIKDSNPHSRVAGQTDAEEGNDEETRDFVIEFGTETVDSARNQDDNPESSEEDDGNDKTKDRGNKKDGYSNNDPLEEFSLGFQTEAVEQPEKLDDSDFSWGSDDTNTQTEERVKDTDTENAFEDTAVELADTEEDTFEQGSGQDTDEQTFNGSHQASDDDDWGTDTSGNPAEEREDQDNEDSNEESKYVKKDYIFDQEKDPSSWDDDDKQARKGVSSGSIDSYDLDNHQDESDKPVDGANSSPDLIPEAQVTQNESDFSGDGNAEADVDDDDDDDKTVLTLDSSSQLDRDVKSDLDESSDDDQEPLYLTVNSESGLGRSFQREFDVKSENKEIEEQDKDNDFSDFSHGTVDTSDDYGGIFKLIDENEVNPPGNNDVEEILKELGTETETDDRQTSGDRPLGPSDVAEDNNKAGSDIEDLPEDVIEEEIIVTDDNFDFDPGYTTRCDPFYDIGAFNVTVSSPIVVEHNSSVTLQCLVVGQGDFRPMTLAIKWEFRPPSCGTEDSSCGDSVHEESFSVRCDPRDKSCTALDYKENSTPSNFTSTLSIKEVQRNQTGLYRCIVYATGCKANRTTTIDATKAVHIRVYSGANYTAHIAIMTVTCVLLMAMLIGLTFLMRSVMKRHRDNYRLIMADTNIQYQPIKALELPPTGVFMNTTAAITRHSIASTFSSKSSFVSAEEAA